MSNANFEYYVPTHICFGDNQLEKTGDELRKHGTKALLIYDSGWIKDTDWYPTVTGSIQDAGVELFELGGVEPNPKTSSVQAAVDICRKEHIDALLAIGGLVIDCAKMSSAAVFHDGDPWDFITGKVKMEKFLSIVVISTISGTGSEMDAYGQRSYSLFFPTIGAFMHLDTSGVYAQVFHICIRRQRTKYPLQSAIVTPLGKPGIHRLPGAVSLRQFPP